MHKTIIVVVALMLLAAIAFAASTLFIKPVSPPLIAPIESATYENPAIGLAFSYKDGAAGYVLEEQPLDSTPNAPLQTITLTAQDDYTRMQQNPPIVGEGPAMIVINVFANSKKQFPLAWAMERPEYSSYNLKMGEEEETVVGGANAVSYLADGLYPTRQVIVAHGANIYVLSGQYLTPESAIRTDFDTLVQSVRFIPEATQSGKIDIKVACESALAYTTFPDSAAAEAFLTACKNGEHPEVIERYKQDLGLDSATI